MSKLQNLATTHGVENLRIFMPAYKSYRYTTVNGVVDTKRTGDIVEFTINEKPFNRKISDGYKVHLVPTDHDYNIENFYICDFDSLLAEHPDRYFIKVNEEKVS